MKMNHQADEFDSRLVTETCVVEYYLTHPAATQWVAVGLARENVDAKRTDGGRRLVTGCGPTESSAIQAMLGRCQHAH